MELLLDIHRSRYSHHRHCLLLIHSHCHFFSFLLFKWVSLKWNKSILHRTIRWINDKEGKKAFKDPVCCLRVYFCVCIKLPLLTVYSFWNMLDFAFGMSWGMKWQLMELLVWKLMNKILVGKLRELDKDILRRKKDNFQVVP